MSDTTNNLSLPFLLASQSQKHVIYNELANKIDALIMLMVKSINLTAPPISLDEQDRYIIADGASGAWDGKSGQIAIWQNLGWQFIIPNNGFFCFCEQDEQFYYYNDGWSSLSKSVIDLDNLQKLGIGIVADEVNPFSVKLNSTFFTAKYMAENGDGDIRLKLNKETSANVASFIFQNNWSGRAEIGLLGNDGFSIKTSSDGSNWKLAASFDGEGHSKFYNTIDLPTDVSGSFNILASVGGSNFIKLPHISGSVGNNTIIGLDTGGSSFTASSADEASYNTVIGYGALKANTTGNLNTAIGLNTLRSNTNGVANTAVGANAMNSNTNGVANTALGHNALINNISGISNTAVGSHGSYFNTIGSNNTAVGNYALVWNVDGTNNTNFTNSTGIGNDARVSSSNQVQLGGSGTTTYAFGAVQDRSDMRDKADIRDTLLGLDFINALRPVDFKWDMRDDYFDKADDGTLVAVDKDGSRKRNRFHHGLIAQEVQEVMAQTGIDFGGFQDHSINGGSDVMSIGYAELIAPLIKAVQELSERVSELKK